MFTKITILFTTLFLASSALGDIHENIKLKWQTLSEEFNLNSNEHGFCYLYNDQIYGETAHLKSRLASTTKPITSLMAIDTLGVEYQFKTILSYDGENLHIKGSNDPLYSEEKLLYLIAGLNSLGIKKIKTLSFDKQVPVFADALKPYMSMSERRANLENSKKELLKYFNFKEHDDLVKSMKALLKNTPQEVLSELSMPNRISNYEMQVNNVIYSEENPLQNKKDLRFFEVTTTPILEYLKYQNSISHNWMADILYTSYGEEAFSSWYLQNFTDENLGRDYVQTRKGYNELEMTSTFYTGSGLDDKRNNERVDNYSTCAVMVRLYQKLNDTLVDGGHNLQEALPVAGLDYGTLKKRLNLKKNLGAILGKTGTLMNTRSLAGKLLTQSGPVYFGFFHHVFKVDRNNAKMSQDLMVNYIIEEFGGSKPISHKEPKYFYPAFKTIEEIKND